MIVNPRCVWEEDKAVITRMDIEQGLMVALRKVSGADVAVVAAERVPVEMSLRDELGIDSLAMIELTEEIKELYGVTIPEESQEHLATFGDAVDYIQSELTAA
jgi:acyl carrier protein